MESKYSIAFIPPSEIIELVDSIKGELFDKIRWFNSRSSKAHITVCEFYATEEQLKKVILKIQEIADSIKPVEVVFDHFDSFANGAFFIGADDNSKKELSKIMKAFHEAVKPIRQATKVSNPHMSIGRQIKEDKLKIAFETFKEINISFRCESVSIRVFNEDRRQYDIKSSYPFNGNLSTEAIQTSLF